MTDMQETALAAVILVVGLLAAPLVIDRVPLLANLPVWIKIILCFLFSGLAFFTVILTLAAAMKLIAAVSGRRTKGRRG